jgi:hypothetical protein
VGGEAARGTKTSESIVNGQNHDRSVTAASHIAVGSSLSSSTVPSLLRGISPIVPSDPTATPVSFPGGSAARQQLEEAVAPRGPASAQVAGLGELWEVFQRDEAARAGSIQRDNRYVEVIYVEAASDSDRRDR